MAPKIEICIEGYNIEQTDFYIAHMLEIECGKECQRRGIKAPCWSSANTPGGDEKNAAYLEKYSPRIKML